jgi:hypothetical protein
MSSRTFVANEKLYLISAHAWRKIRVLDIDIADIVRVIETTEKPVRLKHKTEYTGCYTPRWAQRKGETRNLQVKVVINTRSTLTLKTIHNIGECPEES